MSNTYPNGKQIYCRICYQSIEANCTQCEYCGDMYASYSKKNALISITLNCLFGSLGVYNFYMGYNIKGCIQLLLAISGIGYFIALLLSFFDAILILSDNAMDPKGKAILFRNSTEYLFALIIFLANTTFLILFWMSVFFSTEYIYLHPYIVQRLGISLQ